MGAHRKIIADSDDEDEGDFSPAKYTLNLDGPETELLSPQHQPAQAIASEPSALALSDPQIHNETSGTTDPSFFAGIYDDHQRQALEHSNLVESVVRLANIASASSGEVSLPAKAENARRRDNDIVSSGTNLTSPVTVNRRGLRKSQLVLMSEVSEVTTPRKSAGKNEWDVPSSDDDDPIPKERGLWVENTLKVDKKRKAPTSEHVVSDSAALDEVYTVTMSPEGALKRRRVSSTGQNNALDTGVTDFYIAESRLSISQRQQYRKTQDGYQPDIPGTSAIETMPPPPHKSSGATTIAYSTPSRYASSGPKAVWETTYSVVEDSRTEDAFDLTRSSPDIIASTTSSSKRRESSKVFDSATPKSSSRVKRRKTRPIDDDDDELAQDDSYSIAIQHKDTPRRPEDGDTAGSDTYEKFEDTTELAFKDENSDFDPDVGDLDLPRSSSKNKRTSKKQKNLAAVQDVAPAKKRGRKKKEHIGDASPSVPQKEEEGLENSIPAPLGHVPAINATLDKPKKKRGRPRKFEAIREGDGPASKKETVPGDKLEVDSESPKLRLSQSNEATEESVAIDSGNMEHDILETGAREENVKCNISPLKEVDRNLRLSSQSSLSNSDMPLTNNITKSVGQQAGKVIYRVGLSKRSRIAPLLKCIKK
ncbi:hypothetical protein BX600DRAFT_493461 [Xylariales sp. PMI_506]|nr:hypothetical protein BX600DRAFT_493461 [Xylariales sp. PMI_506]